MSSISENVDDRLSSLPEDVLSYILSLTPTKFAVQTTILSKRWRYSWMLVMNLDFDDTHGKPPGSDTNLDFDYIHGKSRSLDRFVDQVFKYRKISQVNSFRLHLSSYYSCASSWIDKAVQLNVHELDIHAVKVEPPLSMFTCKTLTKLRLRYNVDDDDQSVWKWTSSVCLPCLKTLDIVVYKNPFQSTFKLISGCPMLECLSLEVTIRNDEKNYIFNIPTLKRLKLTFSSVITIVVKEVVLNVPNLEYLFVGGVLYSFFVMEDVSSLVEASISFSEITYNYLWVELLTGISGVKSLSAHNVSSHVDINIPFTSYMPIFPNMKHLELKGFWHYRLIHRFLSTPGLKHLGIEKVYT
ncbi:F-box/LRR-repeat protein At3g59200-like [Bidens hawaiensis]|uniref:F-box/LRR-repeat protein At3g59200-like n=1 Tax=Bidens hawaiensis TaxID=980011 RepID=UPI004049C72F